MITALQIIGGLILLFFGGEILVRGAVALARDLGLSIFVIGLTVVAYGTSSPEMVISVQAALNGYPDIALGNVIGSNISNILCVMGLTAMIYPVAVDKKVAILDGFVMLVVAGLLYALCLMGVLNFTAGVILLVALIVYTFFIFRTAKKNKDKLPEAQTAEIEEQVKIKLNLWQAVLACVVGIILLMIGGDTLIKGAVTLAKMAGLSEAVIGVTLVAFGSSVPELVTSVVAAFHKKSEIVFGNIIGSNLFNIMGIMGVTSIVSPVAVEAKFIRFDLPVLMVVTAILFAMMYYLPRISRMAGVAFFLGYVGYVAAQF